MSQFLLVFLSSWLPFISEASVKKLPFLENILFHHKFLGRFIHLLQLIWIFHIPDITTFLSADFWYVDWLVALFDIKHLYSGTGTFVLCETSILYNSLDIQDTNLDCKILNDNSLPPALSSDLTNLLQVVEFYENIGIPCSVILRSSFIIIKIFRWGYFKSRVADTI